ncbi:hypothetical protein BDV93DRAFT_608475 [Ceratobasidium sp. AG-I]|nr:hypothetical protein BDV93DRAFT_608475 [Ceratobasidium sp. AG-I]
MADPAQTDPEKTTGPGAAPAVKTVDPARLKAMKDNVEGKYAGTQETLQKNKQKEEENGDKKGLRAKQMEGIVKHHND